MSYLDDLFDLQDRVAVVIGGTGELCGEMAYGLAEAGCEVILSGRNEAKAEEKLDRISEIDGRAYFVEAEVTQPGSVEALVDIVSERSGQIDILINGAGINSATPFLEIDGGEMDRIFDTNFKGVVHACQIFGRYFVQHDRPASIINIGSISGLNPLSQVYLFSAAKAAVHNLTRNLAREWAENDIRVNTLVPGFFPAQQNREVLDESRVLEILRQTPASRFGSPEELIGATLLLASSKAGRFITGTELVVDGGFQAMKI